MKEVENGGNGEVRDAGESGGQKEKGLKFFHRGGRDERGKRKTREEIKKIHFF